MIQICYTASAQASQFHTKLAVQKQVAFARKLRLLAAAAVACLRRDAGRADPSKTRLLACACSSRLGQATHAWPAPLRPQAGMPAARSLGMQGLAA